MTFKCVSFSFPDQILIGSTLAGLMLSRLASSPGVAPANCASDSDRPVLDIAGAAVGVWQTGVRMPVGTRLVYYVVDTHICSIEIELNLHIDCPGQESIWHPLHPQVGPPP